MGRAREILDMDVTKGGNKVYLNELLWKIKPVQIISKKDGVKPGNMLSTEMLEKIFLGIANKYNYVLETRTSFQLNLETKKKSFEHYSCTISNAETFNVYYGRTLWEIYAKAIVVIYSHVTGNGGDL